MYIAPKFLQIMTGAISYALRSLLPMRNGYGQAHFDEQNRERQLLAERFKPEGDAGKGGGR